MAKADIGNKSFSQLIADLSTKPHKNIIERLNRKMFPLDFNKVFNYKPEHLATKEYTRCLNLFESRNPGLSPDQSRVRIGGVQTLIAKCEKPVKTHLQNLAINTIREIYEVPDYVNLKAMLVEKIGMDTEQEDDKSPFVNLSLEQKNEMRDEIQKRIILNGLVHGSSLHIWKGIYHLVSDKLDSINPDLVELYNVYTSCLGLQLWLSPPEALANDIEIGRQLTQGVNQIKFNREQGFGGDIEVMAINFPVMLHELNKGVIDWILSAGIPQHYTEEQLKYYYRKADSYVNEIWHYLLAPTLWNDLLETAQIPNEKLPKLLARLAKMSYPDLVKLFRLIMDNKEEASKQIKSWKL